jgi:hypothetical protein
MKSVEGDEPRRRGVRARPARNWGVGRGDWSGPDFAALGIAGSTLAPTMPRA